MPFREIATYKERREAYGSPRIYADLKEAGAACSEKHIARLMSLNGIAAVRPKRFVGTPDSDHDLPVVEDVLGRTVGAERPKAHWTADITYLWTGQGWHYLAVVLDPFSRRVV
jgi:transposase InsO family protein